MTDRRRNYLILGLVALLLIGSLLVIIPGSPLSKPTRQGLDLKGGTSLVYEAKPTKYSKVTSDSLQRTMDIMRERVDQLGVSEPEIQQSGDNQIEVSLPDVKNADQAQQQVGTTAVLAFYDWEKNVRSPECKAAPTDAAVTGGQQAGQPGAGSMTYYEAVTRAAKNCQGTDEPDDTTQGTWYGIDPMTKAVVCGPATSESDAQQTCENNGKTAPKYVEVPQGYLIVQAESDDTSKASQALARDAYFILKDDPGLLGRDIKNPQQNIDSTTGQPDVTFDFTSAGRKKWQNVTREIAQRGQAAELPGVPASQVANHFAIVLDNKLISVPYIDPQQNPDGIDGSNGSQISGSFTIKSAQRLANLIKTGALPIRLELISQSQVSATLGQQALHDGLIAGIVGFAIVALFLLVFYRVLGVVAVGALFIYAIYLFALIKLIPITMTLPGIAGLILTIGVAADANIVIFERVKEEIRAGRSVPAGIAQGYKKGIAAIVDANVVTIMVAFILFVVATAGVRGFAFTLGIGTMTSLFTAVLATQAVLGTMQRSPLITHPSALGAGEAKRRWTQDFMGAAKWFFSTSGVILLIGALAIGGKGLNFGIDFESGTRAKAAFVDGVPSETKVADALQAAGFKNPEVQKVKGDKELKGEGIQISLAETGAKVSGVEQVLTKKFGATKTYQQDSIGPTFGKTVAKSAIFAIIASLLVISVYIALRFEWKFAVPVLIALMHDLLITAGVYSLTGREVTTSTVAALLTILGYSLYDTIIVFDRIRENMPRMPRAAFTQIVNRSMSEVLTRSLATSFCTLLPILALLFFGGDTLKDFAFALMIGVISGAYSSVFIASPVLAHWKEREELYRRRRLRIAEDNGGVVPAYATAAHGVTVEPKGPKRPGRRITAPEDPSQGVSQDEFQQMVADIEHETAPSRVAAKTKTKERERPAPKPEVDPSADARPEDLVLKDDKRDKPKRSRNKRHGRPR
ncbi:MAG TPA: protein translocase subunit SecD [Baekduia sp.]|uniref:protein translocase subunit SecD n=1 Tax=Baekduia sp. TaxID=2600305 RepID=UPI002D796E7C|nr:protein translocase subunit SecD [Baekduia sp.]HET6507413.1 protein translocase subunit SecD [Baekduia sp.]